MENSRVISTFYLAHLKLFTMVIHFQHINKRDIINVKFSAHWSMFNVLPWKGSPKLKNVGIMKVF